METSIFKNRYYFVILFVGVFILAACTKDYVTQCIEQGRVQEELPEYSFLLPVNLSTYHLLTAQTKSGDGEDEEPQVDGGVLNECIIIAVYRDNGILDSYWDLVNHLDNNRLDDAIHPSPGGGGSDKPYQELTYTLTIVSKFCTGNSLTCQVQYVKGGQAAFTAVSSYNDSCIFHGWLFHGNLFSNSPDISVVMDDDYTYVAKYQSILNKDCYDLAKLSTDPLLKSKIDRLRTGTKQYEVEHGVAQRSDNGYYKMTAGTTGHIPMPQEPGIKYSGINHTHPSGYCCVSGGDLVGLMICMN